MVDVMNVSQESAAFTSANERRRQVAWILILIADAGFLAWGAMAAALPDLLPGRDRSRRHCLNWFQAAVPRILNSCDPTATNHPAKDNSQTRVSTGPIAQG